MKKDSFLHFEIKQFILKYKFYIDEKSLILPLKILSLNKIILDFLIY